VSTLTEIHHFLRLLFSKLGTPHCPGCGRTLIAQTRSAIVDEIIGRYRDRRATILAPKVAGRKGYHKDVLQGALKKGYGRARIDGKMQRLSEGMALSRYHEHTIELVIGTINAGRTASDTIENHIQHALSEGEGNLIMVDAPNRIEEIFSLNGTCPSCGIGVEKLDPRLFSFNSRLGACPQCTGLGEIEAADRAGTSDIPDYQPCSACGGSRLKKEALAVKIGGQSIWDLVSQTPDRLLETIQTFAFQTDQRAVADPIVAELHSRLELLNQLGLSYLTLSRSGATLSGGEAQRVRLAAQLGSNLTGVCYILDEPTIGLHPRDNRILIDALQMLKARGNSILVVEHDEETIRAADTIIDLGPGAGQEGGRLVVAGNLNEVLQSRQSVTGASLNGHPRRIGSRLRSYRKQPAIQIRGARARNLKSINVDFPLGTLICLTGVSGSGKSTLLKETLYRGLMNRLQSRDQPTGVFDRILGWEKVSRVLEVDHSPIGRTPRSVPASYVGFLDAIRKLFALTPAARARAYTPSRFSFNMAGGRCEACKGQGQPKVAMNFLPDVYVPCEVCRGSRFNRETLEITYKGKSIADILQLTFDEAGAFFTAIPDIRQPIQFVRDIGLGYVQLGQPSPTLSGGEAQRIKLARQLAGGGNGHTVYILDEPTTGLHMADTHRLINVLQALVDAGNTVAVIEHNLDVIAAADYIIDLGPEGGKGGGRVVTKGSPRELLRAQRRSYTAQYLKRHLRGG
jgi:excinuclease ABC subunit A